MATLTALPAVILGGLMPPTPRTAVANRLRRSSRLYLTRYQGTDGNGEPRPQGGSRLNRINDAQPAQTGTFDD